MTSETAMRAAWTQRNEVGPGDQARGSSQMASANRGQISHVQTPTRMRNTAQRRESTIRRRYRGQLDAILDPMTLPAEVDAVIFDCDRRCDGRILRHAGAGPVLAQRLYDLVDVELA